MRAPRLIAFTLAACLTPAAHLAAGDKAPSVAKSESAPPFVALHISIRSPAGLLKAIDAFAANSTRTATEYPIPPGMTTMTANLVFPALFNNLDAIHEFHIVFAQPSMLRMGPAFVFRTDGFAAFLDKLRDSGVAITDLKKKQVNPGVNAEIPGIGSMAVADIGNGWIAAGQSWGLLNSVVFFPLFRRPPRHDSEADIAVAYHVPKDWEWRQAARDTIAWMRKRKPAYRLEFDRLGIHPDIADGLARLIDKYAPVLFAELSVTQTVLLELSIGEDRVDVMVSIDAIPESIAARIARSAGTTQLEPLAYAIDADVISLIRGKSSGFFDAVSTASADMADHMVSQVFPPMRHRLKSTFATLLDQKGEYATVSRRGRNGAYRLTWRREQDTERHAAAFDELFIALAAMTNAAVLYPSVGVDPAISRKTSPGGHAYSVFSLSPKDPERFSAFVEKLAEKGVIPRPAAGAERAFAFHLGARDGLMVTGYGDLDDDEFAAGLDGPDPLPPPAALETAELDAVNAIPVRQLMLGIVNFDAALLEAAQAMADRVDLLQGTTRYRRALARAIPGRAASGELVGFGVGVRDGRLAAAASFTSGAVRAFLKNLAVFETALRGEAPIRSE